MGTARLARRERIALTVQREVGRILGPLWIPLDAVTIPYVYGWRVEGTRATRREYKRLRAVSASPILVCANHLTMIDSLMISIALGSPWHFITRFRSLPWNTPAQENFAHTWWLRVLAYVMKCLPVRRGGDRRDIGHILACITHLVSQGDVALIFPEGGRSRSGRVNTEARTYGVGRIVRSLPGCRVLCVYLRGDRQVGYSKIPARGDRFHVELESFEPKSDQRGLRGSLDISDQILNRLAAMEQRHFDDRQ